MMFKTLLPVLLLFSSCSTTTYYVVRHAEKAAQGPNMTTDVPLSTDGEARALALKETLKDKRLKYVYSTNTIRTKSTVRPLAEGLSLNIETYDPRDTTFVSYVKNRGKGNAIIVGHSNTVDDIVNRFIGRKELSDLPDSQYGDLFIITRKGKAYSYTKSHFGK